MIERKKINFNSFEEIGTKLKKLRIEKNESIDSISSKLFIKNKYIDAIENGTLQKLIVKETYIKGFIRSYSSYLDENLKTDIENLFLSEKNNVKKTKIAFQRTPPKEKISGSIVILLSLVFMGSIYLFWNKQTYIDLYEIGQKLSVNHYKVLYISYKSNINNIQSMYN